MPEGNPYAPPSALPEIPDEPPITPPGLHNYATRSQRFLGSLIDSIITLAVISLITFSALSLIEPTEDEQPLQDQEIVFEDDQPGFEYEEEPSDLDAFWDSYMEDETFQESIISSAIAFIGIILIQGYFWHTRSQSIGKIIMKTKIVTLDGRPVSFGRIAFLREGMIHFLMWVPGIGNFISLLDAILIFRRGHNCLHDDIARTRVIAIYPKTPLSPARQVDIETIPDSLGDIKKPQSS